jgi:hypothetical protein
MQTGKMASWISFFKGILDTSLGEQFETSTESSEQIEALDKTPFWKLKGIVA